LEKSAVQRALRFFLAVLVVGVLLSFMVAYNVRFTEAAVLTTFGKATQSDVKTNPGLYFKWPYPIQSAMKYDVRTRLLTLRVETQQTADNRQVAVETFCTWKVSDPLKFFQTFSNAGERADEHYKKAEEALKANLRAAAGVVSNYTMEDLFTTEVGKSKLPELEQRMLAAFRQGADKQQLGGKLDDYGIAAVDVGLTRVLLPEEVTKAVFDRMRSTRTRLAKEIETQGQSQAQAIRDRAKADADKITAFAERLAQDIRTRGDEEAAPFLAQMNKNPELAVFLSNMDFIRQVTPRTTTLVLPSSMPGMQMLMPDALQGLRAGEVPAIAPGGMQALMNVRPPVAKGDAKPADQPKIDQPKNAGGGNR
jgi:modulator of FtsH protease HflC